MSSLKWHNLLEFESLTQSCSETYSTCSSLLDLVLRFPINLCWNLYTMLMYCSTASLVPDLCVSIVVVWTPMDLISHSLYRWTCAFCPEGKRVVCTSQIYIPSFGLLLLSLIVCIYLVTDGYLLWVGKLTLQFTSTLCSFHPAQYHWFGRLALRCDWVGSSNLDSLQWESWLRNQEMPTLR